MGHLACATIIGRWDLTIANTLPEYPILFRNERWASPMKNVMSRRGDKVDKRRAPVLLLTSICVCRLPKLGTSNSRLPQMGNQVMDLTLLPCGSHCNFLKRFALQLVTNEHGKTSTWFCNLKYSTCRDVVLNKIKWSKILKPGCSHYLKISSI